MQLTVGKHIEQLQERREKLSAYLMNRKLNRTRRNRIEAEIRWVDLALDHFRAALAGESKIPSAMQLDRTEF